MRILVTGHLGYIGPAIVSELLGQGHIVTGLDSRIYALSRLPAPEISSTSSSEGRLALALDVPMIEKDVRDIEASDLSGFDAVVHLAGLSNDPLGAFDESLTFRINRDMAVQLALTARNAGVRRFLFASSCSVYGESSGELLRETSRTAPVTAYASAKLQAEEQISALATSDFSPCFLRSGTVYGATPHMRFDLVVNNLVAWALATGHVHLKSDGQAWRPIVHVLDVARAFVGTLALNESEARDQIFNIAAPNGNFRIIEIARLIETEIPGSKISFAGDADADRRDYLVDGGKLDRVLGPDWQQMEFNVGLPDLVERLSRLHIVPDIFEGAPFNRLANLKQQITQGVLDENLRPKRRP